MSVAAMTAAQLLLKKGMLVVGQFPQNLGDFLPFLAKAFTNAYVLSAMFFTLATALAWILAVSKAELSYIYPFMAMSYVLFQVYFCDKVFVARHLDTAVFENLKKYFPLQ